MRSNFIISAPRSGSTWLSKMIDHHPEITAVERRLFGNYADFVTSSKSKDSRLRITLDKFVSSISNHYDVGLCEKKSLLCEFIKTILMFESKNSNSENIIDKITPYPGTVNVVCEGIEKYFKDCKIILLIRDGRDVLTSGTFNWIDKCKDFKKKCSFESQREKSLVYGTYQSLGKFFLKEEVIEWSNLWVEVLNSFKVLEENHSVILIKYEDLSSDCYSVLKKCFDFLNLSTCENIINRCIENCNFDKMSGGRSRGEMKINSHVRKGVCGDWVNYFSQDDAYLFNRIAGKHLLAYDYEKSSCWPLEYNFKYQ